MDLIKKLDTVLMMDGHWRRYGIFYCPLCKKEVKRRMDSGKNYKSCGCRSDSYYKTKLFRVWMEMKSRCNYKKHIGYHRYGGRGITICDEWSDFKVFREWAISNGYKEYLRIDREDYDGMYCPENCRFVSTQQSAVNRSGVKMSFPKVGILRALYNAGMTNKRLTEIFGISPATASQIATGKRWPTT